jgi:hypothetical protein
MFGEQQFLHQEIQSPQTLNVYSVQFLNGQSLVPLDLPLDYISQVCDFNLSVNIKALFLLLSQLVVDYGYGSTVVNGAADLILQPLQ